MRENIRFKGARFFSILLLIGFVANFAWAETTEIVTYYPTSSNTGDLHTTSLTVGNNYLNTTLANGQALIQTSLGIGPGFGGGAGNLLEVRGVGGVTSNALFLAGAGAGSNIRVGIGVPAPNEQLEIAGNFRLPAATATTGMIKSGGSRYIHNFGADNFFAGVNAGNLTLTGNSLTGVGVDALLANTNGSDNTALGYWSLRNNASGSRNTAVGHGAINENLTGSDNTAVGSGTLQRNTTGSGNTALGYRAGTFIDFVPVDGNAAGTNNTFIGFQARPGADMTLNNATAIGANALVSASNALVLGGTGANAVNVGIGTATPAQRLHVVGTVRIVDGTQAAGRVLTSDANGVASWQAGGGFPAPNYDSGWVTVTGAAGAGIPGGYFARTLTHNLGTLETFVFIESRKLGETQTHQLFYGMEDTSGDNQLGVSWVNKTATQITVLKGDNDGTSSNTVRVRMWRIG